MSQSESDSMDLQESGYSLPTCPDIVLTSYPDAPPPYRYSPPTVPDSPPPAYEQLALSLAVPPAPLPRQPHQEDRQVCSLYTVYQKKISQVIMSYLLENEADSHNSCPVT